MDQPQTIQSLVQQILQTALALNIQFSPESPLLGALPEFDSASIMTILTMLEDHYGFQFDDDELSAEIFATFGSLCQFVQAKHHANC
ncbi:MAG: acyl carrier protein [Rheinheimera sp.]|jgi:acyl carrier protein